MKMSIIKDTYFIYYLYSQKKTANGHPLFFLRRDKYVLSKFIYKRRKPFLNETKMKLTVTFMYKPVGKGKGLIRRVSSFCWMLALYASMLRWAVDSRLHKPQFGVCCVNSAVQWLWRDFRRKWWLLARNCRIYPQ